MVLYRNKREKPEMCKLVKDLRYASERLQMYAGLMSVDIQELLYSKAATELERQAEEIATLKAQIVVLNEIAIK